MLRVTTTPQDFISFLLMLLNTGTQLTWHCKQRGFFKGIHQCSGEINNVRRSQVQRYLETKAYGGHGVENRSPGG